MAILTLLGRDFDIAPYKLAQLRQAAPFIEKINATVGALTTLDGAVSVMGDLVGFLAIGIARIDPSVTVAALEDALGFDDLPVLQSAFLAVLRESGFTAGDSAPLAPAETAGEADSSDSSAPSSSSSSLPA